jgi:hypothetical protein
MHQEQDLNDKLFKRMKRCEKLLLKILKHKEEKDLLQAEELREALKLEQEAERLQNPFYTTLKA